MVRLIRFSFWNRGSTTTRKGILLCATGVVAINVHQISSSNRSQSSKRKIQIQRKEHTHESTRQKNGVRVFGGLVILLKVRSRRSWHMSDAWLAWQRPYYSVQRLFLLQSNSMCVCFSAPWIPIAVRAVIWVVRAASTPSHRPTSYAPARGKSR